MAGQVVDISVRRALVIPSLIAIGMIAIASALSVVSGVSGWRVFAPYVGAWSACALLSVLIWVFVEVARLLPTRADRPLHVVFQRVGRPLEVILLPAIIFPLFLGGYSWAKTSIPILVGYGWESEWAAADHLFFGQDAWRWAHTVSPDFLAPAWAFYYAIIWGAVLVFSGTLIAVFAHRRFASTFYTSLMLTWLIGGVAMAFAISASGPVFAHLADPEFSDRFLELRTELTRLLGHDNMVVTTQRYLAAGLGSKIAVKGGGVSAMPSMHMATATIVVLAAWRTKWRSLGLLFWAMTFFGSVYLGYHYAVDAPVAAAVAWFCWRATEASFRMPDERPSTLLAVRQ